RNKPIQGFFWSTIANFSNIGIKFIIGIILARILDPSEFGLIGLLTVFIAVSNVFIDSGFSQSLIRKTNCDRDDYTTVFLFNIFVSAALYGLLFLSSNMIATFFDRPILSSIIKVYALILILQSFSLIHRTILIKEMNFRFQSKVTIISSILSGIIGIWMAYSGYGVWSLVYRLIALHLFTNIFLWIYTKWYPSIRFNIAKFKEHAHFGIKLLFSALLDTIFNNNYYLIIGKYFSPTQLGYYTRAEQFKKLPSQNLLFVINRVTYPALAKVKDDKVLLISSYKKLLKHVSYGIFTIMMILAAISHNLILVLLGDKWLPAAPYLTIMCFSAMIYPLSSLNLNLLKVLGRSDLFLKIEVIKKIIIIPTIIVGIFYGIKAMLLLMVLNSYISYSLNCYYSDKLIQYRILKQLKDLLPNFIISFTIGIVVYMVVFLNISDPVWELILQLLISVIAIIGFSILFKNKSYLYGLSLLREYKSKLKRV
nr:lipopolysaccharide biosynthesis protein [Bacteroidales bacterium]